MASRRLTREQSMLRYALMIDGLSRKTVEDLSVPKPPINRKTVQSEWVDKRPEPGGSQNSYTHKILHQPLELEKLIESSVKNSLNPANIATNKTKKTIAKGKAEDAEEELANRLKEKKQADNIMKELDKLISKQAMEESHDDGRFGANSKPVMTLKEALQHHASQTNVGKLTGLKHHDSGNRIPPATGGTLKHHESATRIGLATGGTLKHHDSVTRMGRTAGVSTLRHEVQQASSSESDHNHVEVFVDEKAQELERRRLQWEEEQRHYQQEISKASGEEKDAMMYSLFERFSSLMATASTPAPASLEQQASPGLTVRHEQVLGELDNLMAPRPAENRSVGIPQNKSIFAELESLSLPPISKTSNETHGPNGDVSNGDHGDTAHSPIPNHLHEHGESFEPRIIVGRSFLVAPAHDRQRPRCVLLTRFKDEQAKLMATATSKLDEQLYLNASGNKLAHSNQEKPGSSLSTIADKSEIGVELSDVQLSSVQTRPATVSFDATAYQVEENLEQNENGNSDKTPGGPSMFPFPLFQPLRMQKPPSYFQTLQSRNLYLRRQTSALLSSNSSTELGLNSSLADFGVSPTSAKVNIDALCSITDQLVQNKYILSEAEAHQTFITNVEKKLLSTRSKNMSAATVQRLSTPHTSLSSKSLTNATSRKSAPRSRPHTSPWFSLGIDVNFMKRPSTALTANGDMYARPETAASWNDGSETTGMLSRPMTQGGSIIPEGENVSMHPSFDGYDAAAAAAMVTTAQIQSNWLSAWRSKAAQTAPVRSRSRGSVTKRRSRNSKSASYSKTWGLDGGKFEHARSSSKPRQRRGGGSTSISKEIVVVLPNTHSKSEANTPSVQPHRPKGAINNATKLNRQASNKSASVASTRVSQTNDIFHQLSNRSASIHSDISHVAGTVGDPDTVNLESLNANRQSHYTCFEKDIVLAILRTPPISRKSKDISTLYRNFRSFTAFENLPNIILRELCTLLMPTEMETGDTVYTQGDLGTKWYIIITGSLQVQTRHNIDGNENVSRVATPTSYNNRILSAGHASERHPNFTSSSKMTETIILYPGQGCGESVLHCVTPRLETVRVREPTILLTIDREEYASIVKRVHDDDLQGKVSFLKGIPCFQALAKSRPPETSMVFVNMLDRPDAETSARHRVISRGIPSSAGSVGSRPGTVSSLFEVLHSKPQTLRSKTKFKKRGQDSQAASSDQKNSYFEPRLQAIAANMSWRTLPPGTVILNEGDDIRKLGFVRKGNCRLFQKLMLPNGKETQVCVAHCVPGDILVEGLVATLVKASTAPSTSIAAIKASAFPFKAQYLAKATNRNAAQISSSSSFENYTKSHFTIRTVTVVELGIISVSDIQPELDPAERQHLVDSMAQKYTCDGYTVQQLTKINEIQSRSKQWHTFKTRLISEILKEKEERKKLNKPHNSDGLKVQSNT